MSNPNVTLAAESSPDDLPRTFRRAREEQEREQREREAQAFVASPPPDFAASGEAFDTGAMAQPAVVTAIRMSYLQLMKFFIKAVFAAIPALILLTIVVVLIGKTIETFFPNLILIKGVWDIQFPRR